MDQRDVDALLQVVREVTAKGQLTSLENITKHVGSGASEHEITEALDILVADGRLRKQCFAVGFERDDGTEYHYYEPHRY